MYSFLISHRIYGSITHKQYKLWQNQIKITATFQRGVSVCKECHYQKLSKEGSTRDLCLITCRHELAITQKIKIVSITSIMERYILKCKQLICISWHSLLWNPMLSVSIRLLSLILPHMVTLLIMMPLYLREKVERNLKTSEEEIREKGKS